jgi:hypothetical protein
MWCRKINDNDYEWRFERNPLDSLRKGMKNTRIDIITGVTSQAPFDKPNSNSLYFKV